MSRGDTCYTSQTYGLCSFGDTFSFGYRLRVRNTADKLVSYSNKFGLGIIPEDFKSRNIEEITPRDVTSEADSPFKLKNKYTLDVTVGESIQAKAGTMVAFTGDLSFTGKASGEGGLTGFIKQAATGEGTPIMTVEGQGHVYLADNEKKVQLLELDTGDSITVNGEDILAFEPQVTYEISTMDSLAGAFTGGFTNVYLHGPGYVAITTHADPIVLEPPVSTDPSATVAWDETSPDVQVNKNLSDMIGQESGERFQMNFDGNGGYVIVQPFEEHTGQV